MIPLTEREALDAQMAALYPRTHGPECADRYRAIAEWWRLYAQTTANPDECFRYATAQDAIADDMEKRPDHHQRRLLGKSAYEWSRL